VDVIVLIKEDLLYHQEALHLEERLVWLLLEEQVGKSKNKNKNKIILK